MALIGLFRNLKALAIFALWLAVLPLGAQQTDASQPAQSGNNSQPQPNNGVQGQQAAGNTGNTQPLQTTGITPQMLAIAPAPKLPLPTGQDYSKPLGYFPNPLAPYLVRQVPEASFSNASKLEDMIRDGKIMLSINDAVALALADNLDIAISRYNFPIADTDILRTKAGSFNFGVGVGTIQGTPGGAGIAATAGASGAGAGGTTVGAGGVGAGANGVVNSTLGAGPTEDNWDPTLTGTLQEVHSVSPTTTSTILTGGQPTSVQNSTTGNFTYTQGFSYGSLLSLSYNNQRLIGNNASLPLNPLLSSNFQIQIRQHLLQGSGWGWDVNRRYIILAQDQKRATQESFRQQVASTVSQIEAIYWDLVAAYEDLKVKERSLALDEKTLADNKKQVEIGTMASISVVQAESAVATDQQNLIAAKSTLQLQQLYMKNAISRNMIVGSDLMKSDIIPTDTVVVPEQEASIDVDALIQRTIENHPNFIQQKINLKDRLLAIKGTNNLLRPSVDLFGFYGASSIAGTGNALCTPALANEGACVPASAITPTGFGNAFTNLFNSTGPTKGMAVTINIPIRNRIAQSEQVRAQLEYRQAELSFKQLQNNLALGIRNEVATLENDRARIVAAREAQTFAEQNLDAEQKKYGLGASTSFNVMQMQAQLAIAQETTISAEISYAKQRVQLDLDTAQTLENNHIILAEAVTGQIKTEPNVPGVGPNTFIEQTGPPPVNPPALQQRPNEPNTPTQKPPQ